MDSCIFCKIVQGEIPSHKIHETETTLAFLDIDPINIGHSLVIPKEHFENIYEIPDEILGDLMKSAKKLAKAIKKGLKADGINVTMNNDHAAGQRVFHLHIHVIPRLHDDGHPIWQGKRNYEEGEKDEVTKKITEAL